MALFVKKSDENLEVAQLYTLGQGKTRIFIGLGNPGKKYANNRHNIGFMAIDTFAASVEAGKWKLQKNFKAEIATADVAGTRVILVKPQTFMNKSGEAIQAILQFYKMSLSECVIIHDEIDLDFGKLQIKIGGGAAGHNGLKSIINSLGEDFTRIRIGVGPKHPAEMDLSDYVLQDFTKSQSELLNLIVKEAASILVEATVNDLVPDTRSVI